MRPRLVRRSGLGLLFLLSLTACGEGNARVVIPIGASMRHAADSLEAARKRADSAMAAANRPDTSLR